MLMVIFGAGASYDSIPSYPPGTLPPSGELDRLPLADHLFDNRPEFVRVMTRFPECKPIIPRLQQHGENFSVEQVLGELQAEVDDYPDVLPQLTAIRFYLRNMIWTCEERWKDIAGGITGIRRSTPAITRFRISATARSKRSLRGIVSPISIAPDSG